MAASSECAPLERDARAFAYLPLACPSEYHYMQPATLVLAQYLNLHEARSCPRGFDAQHTLVAHLRRWSFGDATNASSRPSWHDPPLAYYLAAWEASGVPKLLVIAEEDNDSPRLAALLQMRALLEPPRTLSVRILRAGTDLGPLTCARHLALGHSRLAGLLLANSQLRTVYAPEPLTDAWPTSCDTTVYVPSALRHADLQPPWWWAAEAQRLHLSTMLANETIRFEPQRVANVPCTPPLSTAGAQGEERKHKDGRTDASHAGTGTATEHAARHGSPHSLTTQSSKNHSGHDGKNHSSSMPPEAHHPGHSHSNHSSSTPHPHSSHSSSKNHSSQHHGK